MNQFRAQDYKLVTPDGFTIEKGASLIGRNNEEYTVEGWYPKPPPSSGRVVVRRKGVSHTMEFYPHVFNLKLVPR